MKATLEFDLTEERSEFQMAVNSHKYSQLLWKIEQEVFRPARKHGYLGDEKGKQLNRLLDKEGSCEDVYEAIHLLEQMYYELKNELFGGDEDV